VTERPKSSRDLAGDEKNGREVAGRFDRDGRDARNSPRETPGAYKPKYDFTILICAPLFDGDSALPRALRFSRQEGPSCQHFRLFQSLTMMHLSAPRPTIF
jgi:hypothetical protein